MDPVSNNGASFGGKIRELQTPSDSPDYPKSQSYEEIKSIITNAGGVFIGLDELVQRNKTALSYNIPPIPERFGREFLLSEHPIT